MLRALMLALSMLALPAALPAFDPAQPAPCVQAVPKGETTTDGKEPAYNPVDGLMQFDGEGGGSGGPIVFLGDSLTQGPGISLSQAYPALIQKKLQAAGYKFKTVNAGVGGNKSADGLARLDAALKGKPSILVVNFGTNDANMGHGGDAAISATLRSNIDQIVARAQSRKVKVVIIPTKLPSWYHHGLVDGFESAFHSVAASRKVPLGPGLLDGVWGHQNLWLGNGHPNAAGHQVIANNVWSVLQPVVKSLAKKPE